MEALDDFYADNPFVDDTRQRRTFSTFFKKDRFLDWMIINFENAVSPNMLCKILRVYEWLNQK